MEPRADLDSQGEGAGGLATPGLRRLGATIGAATGPVAAFGQSWAGTGDGGLHVWFLATVTGALLGALTYPLFFPAAPGDIAYRSGFAALFGFAVGMLSGAFCAFPMGAVMGGLGGGVAGALIAFIAKRLRDVRGGLVIAGVLGAGLALVLAWLWLA